MTGGFNKAGTELAIGDAGGWLDLGKVASNNWKAILKSKLLFQDFAASYTFGPVTSMIRWFYAATLLLTCALFIACSGASNGVLPSASPEPAPTPGMSPSSPGRWCRTLHVPQMDFVTAAALR